MDPPDMTLSSDTTGTFLRRTSAALPRSASSLVRLRQSGAHTLCDASAPVLKGLKDACRTGRPRWGWMLICLWCILVCGNSSSLSHQWEWSLLSVSLYQHGMELPLNSTCFKGSSKPGRKEMDAMHSRSWTQHLWLAHWLPEEEHCRPQWLC